MSPNKSDKGKHLTAEDRHFIEDALNERCTLKSIAEKLFKDPTTISKEIKRNRIAGTRNKDKQITSCSHRKECEKRTFVALCVTVCVKSAKP